MPPIFVIPPVIEPKKAKRRFVLACIKKLALAIFMLLAHVIALAQRDTSHPMAAYDSLKSNSDSANTDYRSATQRFINQFKTLGVEELRKSVVEYHQDTIVTKQEEIIEQVRELTSEAKSYLKNGQDTSGLTGQLKNLEDGIISQVTEFLVIQVHCQPTGILKRPPEY